MTRRHLLAMTIGTAALAATLVAQTPAPQPPPAATTPAGAQGAQDPQQPVFRAGTETVAIYATVLDRYGEMVLNLDRADFDVYDDGKKQDLTLFVKGLQPITAAVLVDTSASMTLNLELAQAAAEQFVIRMLPGDRVRVGSFSDRIDLGPEFSADRDAILRALRNGQHIGNPTLLWDAVDDAMNTLTPLGGRRVILLLTDGQDTISKKRAYDVLERARTDELMVYAVQFRSTFLAQRAEVPLAPTASQALTDDRNRNPPPTEGLRRITFQTGGGHFLLDQFDDINTTFTRVMQELHYQYTLGFTPQRADGKLHTLEVRIRKPGMVVRARQSYLAGRPSAATAPTIPRGGQ